MLLFGFLFHVILSTEMLSMSFTTIQLYFVSYIEIVGGLEN